MCNEPFSRLLRDWIEIALRFRHDLNSLGGSCRHQLMHVLLGIDKNLPRIFASLGFGRRQQLSAGKLGKLFCRNPNKFHPKHQAGCHIHDGHNIEITVHFRTDRSIIELE